MKQIENPMILPQLEYNINFGENDRYLEEIEEQVYQDKVSKKLLRGGNIK